MSSRVRKQSDGPAQKLGPMKATLPMPSLLRGTIYCGSSFSTSITSPMRHISPEHTISGHRSPGALSYKNNTEGSGIRRTASLDALYMRPSWNIQPHPCTFLQLDKATQTDESFLDRSSKSGISFSPPDMKIEKVIRQRLQRTQRGENSVSSQTLSPVHVKASPVLIPTRNCPPAHMRPMRSSVEGLNQEIEKLVLIPGQQHTCRPESSSMFSRGTPEGHRAPLGDLLHGDTRSVNTQTPIGDMLSSDESQSTSPEDGASCVTGASPRINRFLAREPPDGCEKSSFKVNLKVSDTEPATHFKPCLGFQLRPSLGSAFKLLQPIPILKTTEELGNLPDNDNNGDDNAFDAVPTSTCYYDDDNTTITDVKGNDEK